MAERIDRATVNKIKKDLRISHSKLDDDIQDMAQACLTDLESCGITDPDQTDPLILNALKLWSRANYTDDVNKAGKYQARYDALKAHLMMAGGYGGGGKG
jgi:hypothetical protein